MNVNILIVLFSALASIVAFPVAGGFRIGLGAVVLFACIHAFRVQRPILLSLIAGIAISLTRILVDSFSLEMTGTLASNYLLETFFYVGYGVIYYYAVVKNRSDYPLPLVVALTIGDGGGNFLEYYLRHLAADEAWTQQSLTVILITAVVRSVLIVLLAWILSRYVTHRFGIDRRTTHD